MIDLVVMSREGCGATGGRDEFPNPSAADLLQNLNLTADEEAVLELSDDEEETFDQEME